MTSVVLKHYSSDVSSGVDLWPMPCFKGMKRRTPGLRSHVFGDGEMKIRIGLPPDEHERNVGAPKFD